MYFYSYSFFSWWLYLLCRKDGNPFNTTVIALPPTAIPPSIASAPTSQAPRDQADAPSTSEMTNSAKAKKFWRTRRVIWVALSAVAILCALGCSLFMWRYCKSRRVNRDAEKNTAGAYKGPGEKPNYKNSSLQPSVQVEEGTFIRLCVYCLRRIPFFLPW